MNVKLTTASSEKEVLLNWDNVDYIKSVANHFGDKYTEVHCGTKTLDEKESVEEIETKIKRKNSRRS